jgi:hypothetical protein
VSPPTGYPFPRLIGTIASGDRADDALNQIVGAQSAVVEAYGFDPHTSCHDIQAEAQREYGLTPDDVHDSFNLFMCTEVTLDGRATITRQETKPRCATFSLRGGRSGFSARRR